MILTLMGSALVLIGVPLYVADPGNEGFPARTLGAITCSSGGVAIASGISVWIYGSRRMREAENQGYRAWLPIVAPTRGGAADGILIPTF
jgi:hypothetical protein